MEGRWGRGGVGRMDWLRHKGTFAGVMKIA